MKPARIIAVILSLTLLLYGCQKPPQKTIAFITDMGEVTQSPYHKQMWHGICRATEDTDVKTRSYSPKIKTSASYEESARQAIEDGANIVICNNFLFAPVVHKLQSEFPETSFVLVNSMPKDSSGKVYITSNTIAMRFPEEQAGFLAGYVAVRNGNRKIGFMGGTNTPETVRAGYGFAQGAEFAAKELLLPPDSIGLNYAYLESYEATLDKEEKAKDWYNAGTEIIYAYCKNAEKSIFTAAEATDSLAIGAELDKSADSKAVSFSIVFDYEEAMYSLTKELCATTFGGGRIITAGAARDTISIAMENPDRYAAILQKLHNGEIPILQDGEKKDIESFDFEYVTVGWER